MTEASNLLTIPAAARAAEVPERSLYRAVDANDIPSTIRDGTKFVSLDNVVAWREARKATHSPPPAPEAAPTATSSTASEAPAPALPAPAVSGGNLAAATGGRAPGSPPPPPSDGVLASRLFAAFEQGATATDLVVTEQLSPGVVEAYLRQYVNLRAAGGGDRRSLAERVEALEQSVQALTKNVNGDVWTVMHMQVPDVQSRVELIEAHLRMLPVPRRDQDACGCGHTGYISTTVKCNVCGHTGYWGFQPPR